MPSPFYATASHRLNLRALLGTSNGSDIDAGFAALVADAEANIAGYAEGGSLPAAGISGRIFRMTDGTDRFFIDDGSVWQLLVPSTASWPFIANGTNMNYGPDNANCRLDPGGVVRLRGSLIAIASIASGATLATIPSGYRPASMRGLLMRVFQTGVFNGATGLNIDPSGLVSIPMALGTGAIVYFDGLTYTL